MRRSLTLTVAVILVDNTTGDAEFLMAAPM
jgi:hypothetical protein